MAKERGLTYVKLDGDIGILGNGAGLVMSHARRRRPGGRQAGQLPGRGRRLQGRAVDQRGRGDPLRRQGQGRPVQHLRRHHPLRRGGQGPDRRLRADQAGGSLRRAPRRHQRRGGTQAARPTRTCPTCTRPRRWTRRPRRSWSSRAPPTRTPRVPRPMRGWSNEHPGRQGHQAGRLGHHRPRGHVPRAQQQALRHERRRGRDAGQGAARTSRASRSSTRSPKAVAETGANTAMIFVPPRFAADSILEAADAGIELIIAITEGIPAHDELRVYNAAEARRPTCAWSARTARASCRPARRASASSPRPSSRRATSAWCRARAR